MSQSHFNYMNGVPVKIAESYKPPKKLALTQSVSQRLSTSSSITTQLLERSAYDFGLERTVLAKMNEWQRVRQRENCDRKERMRLYQQERQSLFDAKQKQMLTAVSYPSTDDLSSDDDGDDSGHGTSSDASKSAVSLKTIATPSQKTSQTQQQQQQFSPPNYFNNILVPTVMPGQENAQTKQNVTNAVKSPHYSKFNYHEFENDTSSPFDNVELKTINDLDILAEVWNTSVSINQSTASSSKDNTPTSDDVTVTNPTNATTQLPNQTHVNQLMDMNTYQHSAINSAPSDQTASMQMNHSAAQAATISSFPIGNHFYGNQVHYNHQPDSTTQSYQPIANTAYMNSTINNNLSYTMAQQYAPTNYITEYTTATATTTTTNQNAIATNSMYDGDKTVIVTTTNSSIQTKSKSKSVPDIMEEINTELQNSQGRRVRNNSQSKNKDDSATVATKRTPNSAKTNDAVSSTFKQLSHSSRDLARNISSMGFPLEQVVRIMEKLGKDDKRIVEHLIRLGELLDLGFDEQKISDALLKFDNNKEKALDFLIS